MKYKATNKQLKIFRRYTTINILKISFLVFTSVMFMECGNPDVNINNAPYEPKIAVEGYLYCGEPVKNFRLMRNFALGVQIDTSRLYLTPSRNNVIVTINGTPLNFDPLTNSYYNNQMIIDYGKTYTLEVSATIEGKELHTSSSTTTPQKGFAILNRNLGQYKYNGAPIKVVFKVSPGTEFYALSIVSDTANPNNFIYNNVLRNNIDSTDVEKDLNDLRFRRQILDNIDSYSGNTYSLIINVRDTWFYSTYTLTAYAGDTNFKDYFITAPSVQEFDGNFHEPIQIFDGGGIGVFASAIRDTATFSIVK
jgi:hypothetical protein